MPRVAYVNGRYLPHDDAQVHIEDRGYQFADGVYEVVAVRRDRLVDEGPHLDRLDRSLRELEMSWPAPRNVVSHVIREIVRRNRLQNGIVYLQVSRGVAARAHQFPKSAAASLVLTARRVVIDQAKLRTGVSVISIPDIRWTRCDIKSISLLPNVLGKQRAVEAGAYEAWQVDADGMITEGTSSNAWIVTPDNRLLTRQADNAILNGITRQTILHLAMTHQLTFKEEPFTLGDVRRAREAFLTSSSSLVLPVTRIDGTAIDSGQPGPFTSRLQDAYEQYIDDLPPCGERQYAPPR